MASCAATEDVFWDAYGQALLVLLPPRSSDRTMPPVPAQTSLTETLDAATHIELDCTFVDTTRN